MTSIIAGMQYSLLLLESSKTSWKTRESLKGNNPQSVTFDPRNPSFITLSTDFIDYNLVYGISKDRFSLDYLISSILFISRNN
jgi:hypothetical protein